MSTFTVIDTRTNRPFDGNVQRRRLSDYHPDMPQGHWEIQWFAAMQFNDERAFKRVKREWGETVLKQSQYLAVVLILIGDNIAWHKRHTTRTIPEMHRLFEMRGFARQVRHERDNVRILDAGTYGKSIMKIHQWATYQDTFIGHTDAYYKILRRANRRR